MDAPYCHLLPARLYNIFTHLSYKRHGFRDKNTEHKMCFDLLYNFCPTYFSFQEEMSEIWSKTYIGLQVSCCYSCLILMKFDFCRELKKIPKYHPSSGSPVVPRWQPDGRTETTTPIVAILNFANAPKETNICVSPDLKINVNRCWMCLLNFNDMSYAIMNVHCCARNPSDRSLMHKVISNQRMRRYQREQNPNLKSAATQFFKRHFRRQTLDTSQQLFL
jgi:hypothetical protein